MFSITIEKEIAASNVDKTTKTKAKSVRCKKQDELTTNTIECICKVFHEISVLMLLQRL
jgi:hypothetical protein